MTAPKTVSLDDVRAHLSVWNDKTLVDHFYHVIDELERRQVMTKIRVYCVNAEGSDRYFVTRADAAKYVAELQEYWSEDDYAPLIEVFPIDIKLKGKTLVGQIVHILNHYHQLGC